MAKLTLSDVSNLFGNPTSAANTINNNSQLIEQALENTLSRDGTSPNQMNADLDLNHHGLLNIDSLSIDDITLDGESLLQRLSDESDARIAGDAAEAKVRAATDTALASLIAQGGTIEVPLYDSQLAASLADIKDTINTIFVCGYSSGGDGGEALWRRSLTEPTHDIKFQSLGGDWWEIVPSSVIYANCVGMLPTSDGTSNANSLQKAIDYAKIQIDVILTDKYVITTCDVGIKPGKYQVSGVVNIYTGVRLIGSGMSSTQLVHSGGGSDFIVFTQISNENLFNSRVMDLAIIGGGTTTSDTLSAIRASTTNTKGLAIYGCGVDRCFITNCYDGVGIKESWTFEVIDCIIYNVGRNCIRGENITSCQLIGGRYELAGEDGVYITYGVGTSRQSIACHLSHLVIQSCHRRAIYGIDATHVMWDHNYVEANNQDGGYPAVEFAAVSTTPEFFSFLGGWVSPGSGGTGQPAFTISTSRMVSAHGVYIRGNGFSVGWNLGAGVTGYDIDGEFNGNGLIAVDSTTTGTAVGRNFSTLSGLRSEILQTSSTSSNANSSLTVRTQEIDCTSAGKTYTLLDAHLQRGRKFTVQKTDGGSNALIIAPSGTTKINGTNASVSSTNAFVRAEITCGYEAGTSTPCWYVKFS